mgnify:CR=1 FL=1
MKKTTNMARARRLKNNNQRRVLLKKLHQRVLLRRKQFAEQEFGQDLQQAC